MTRLALVERILLVLLAASMHVAAAPAGSSIQIGRTAPAIRRVVIVSIDGMRPDLLTRGRTPTIQGLLQRGSYTFRARTVDEGYTVPSHTSMLTGVVPPRHGVTWDNHIEDAYPSVPTLFELARRSGYRTAMVAGKTKLVPLNKPGTLDWTYIADESREHDRDVAIQAVRIITMHRPDVLFVHFADVDLAGHASGWGSRAQLAAMAAADRALGSLLEAMVRSGLTDSTLLIVTADHGGKGLLHDPVDPESQLIPWIVVGPSVRQQFDLAALPSLHVNTMATFATACAVLGITPGYAIDAEPVLEIFEDQRRFRDLRSRAPR